MMTDLELVELAARRAAAKLHEQKRNSLAEIFEYFADELVRVKRREQSHAKDD
jgi:hypothetical protein